MRIKNDDEVIELYFVSERDTVADYKERVLITCATGANKLPLSVMVDDKLIEGEGTIELSYIPKEIIVGGICIDELSSNKQTTIVLRPKGDDDDN